MRCFVQISGQSINVPTSPISPELVSKGGEPKKAQLMETEAKSSGWELAQLNIARLREPLDSDLLKDFVANIERVNAEADRASGFIWRLKGEDGDATSIRAFEWDANGSAGVTVNLSTWDSIESLRNFVFSGDHVKIMRRRFEWFHKVSEMTTFLWWVPKGHIPTTAEAEAKLLEIRRSGPTPNVFTLQICFNHLGERMSH